ncbi:MAG: hypothetical protein ACHBN1_29715 [Heteroscytonema crispum UTEX LB 1556]
MSIWLAGIRDKGREGKEGATGVEGEITNAPCPMTPDACARVTLPQHWLPNAHVSKL